MNKIREEICEELLLQYGLCEIKEKKEIVRNKIYTELRPFITKWISSILHKKGVYLEPEEILSKSWDCFEFCLKRFNSEKPFSIPNHFYTYTKFCLLTKPKTDNLTADYGQEIDTNISGSIDQIYESIDELKSFRAILDQEYLVAFDDAVMSLAGRMKDRQYSKEITVYERTKYQTNKKLFKIVIDYLLRR